MTLRKTELFLVIVLFVIALPSQGTYSTRIDRGKLIVFESRGNASREDSSPFDLQNAVDEALEQGIQALVLELDEFSFRTKLKIRKILSITSGSSNSMKTELRCFGDNSMFDIRRRRAENLVVELKNVRITGCKTRDQEGVIHVGSRAHVVFEDVEVVKNIAENASHSIVAVDSNAKLEVRGGSSFSNNEGRVLLSGNGSEVIIQNSSFRNNSAATNGSVLATRTDSGIQLSVRGSRFEGNVAQGSSGGVMWLESSTIVLENGVRFSSNVADHDGGALFLRDSLGLQLSDTLFENNSCALGRGGAILLLSSVNSTTQLRRTIFNRNLANGLEGIGGAIAFKNVNASSTQELRLGSDVLFLRNTARVSGGAVFVNGTNAITSSSSAFINNTAQGEGGGIYISSSVYALTTSVISFASSKSSLIGLNLIV